jgi:hypothetical protein
MTLAVHPAFLSLFFKGAICLVCWSHFHGRAVKVLNTVIVDQSPPFVDPLVTPSLPDTAGRPLCSKTATASRLSPCGIILRLSSCRLMEGFVIPSLPHLAVETIKLSMAPLLHPHYQTSELLRATPPSCCLRPFSRVRSYRTDLF